MNRLNRRSLLSCGTVALAGSVVQAQDTRVVAQPMYAVPPRDAVVLFDGKDGSAWQHVDGKELQWPLVDGCLEIKPGTKNIITKQEFTDFQLHVEFWLPKLPPEVKSQARCNSGVYMQGRYEIQILDMFNNETYAKGGGGAIYEVKDPDVLACLPPEQWQTYDVYFHAPRFDAAGNKTANARMTALWNGIFIHESVEIPGHTRAALMTDPKLPGGVMLQDHSNKLRYRNLWIRPMK